MPYGIYMSAEGARVQSERLNIIANNLANANTVGFKQDVPSFQARFAEAIQRGQAAPGDRSINEVGGGVKLIDVSTDFSPGDYQSTGNPFDIAISGEGFFHILGDEGDTCLSRAGNFALDPSGRLVTEVGRRPVLDQSDTEIVLDRDLPWELSDDGFISQAGTLRALGLSEPDSLDELVKIGDNLFRPTGPVAPVPLADRQVRQGYLEMSDSNQVEQMMSMIETTRAFEANTRMIQSQDAALGTLIGRVLRV